MPLHTEQTRMTSPAQKPFGNSSLLLACSAFALAVFTQATALAKDEKSETAPSTKALEGNVSDVTETDSIDEIVVQSTRRDQTINEVSRSVRVFSDDDIAKFLQQTTSVQEILGRVYHFFKAVSGVFNIYHLTSGDKSVRLLGLHI